MPAASERGALLTHEKNREMEAHELETAGRRRADRALVAGCLLATLGVIATGKRSAPPSLSSEPDRTVRPALPASRNLTRALPTLGINGSLVSVSGLSSGADMAVQFHVAHSSRVMGAAIFAGEPYHCALTLFPAEMAQGISEPPPYDHCKSTPEVRSSPKGCLVKLSDVSPSRPPSQKVVEGDRPDDDGRQPPRADGVWRVRHAHWLTRRHNQC